MEALGNTGFATTGSGTLLGIYLPIWLMIAFLVLGCWITAKPRSVATSTRSVVTNPPRDSLVYRSSKRKFSCTPSPGYVRPSLG